MPVKIQQGAGQQKRKERKKRKEKKRKGKERKGKERKEKKRKEKKRKEKKTPFGVNLMRSQILYRAEGRETNCLNSAFASNTHCILALPSACLASDTVLPCTHALLLPATRKGKKRKDCAFRRQFNEKPSIIPGCPILATKVILNCRWATPSSDAGPLQKAFGGAGQRAEPGCPAAPSVRCPAELHAVQPRPPPSPGLSPHTHSSAQCRYVFNAYSSCQV